jgi:hypothetical protein
MKRFTNDGTNEQEGRELIPAHRNAEEEEEALGLSFERGEAGARTLSRRQALGLLGGSIAGLTLLSPAKSQAVVTPPFADRDHITLECKGTVPGPRFLDGRTADGTVGLAPSRGVPFTGTKWELYTDSDRSISLKCLGTVPGNRYLDGRTADGTVGLAPYASYPSLSGTWWKVRILPK